MAWFSCLGPGLGPWGGQPQCGPSPPPGNLRGFPRVPQQCRWTSYPMAQGSWRECRSTGSICSQSTRPAPPCSFGQSSTQGHPDVMGEDTCPALVGSSVQKSAVVFNLPPALTNVCSSSLCMREKKQTEREIILS